MSKRRIGKVLTYEPLDWQISLGYMVHTDRCKATCFNVGFTGGQCSRNPKEKVKGVGFCKQHAKMARGGEKC
jgi:hypothetical protein